MTGQADNGLATMALFGVRVLAILPIVGPVGNMTRPTGALRPEAQRSSGSGVRFKVSLIAPL